MKTFAGIVIGLSFGVLPHDPLAAATLFGLAALLITEVAR